MIELLQPVHQNSGQESCWLNKALETTKYSQKTTDLDNRRSECKGDRVLQDWQKVTLENIILFYNKPLDSVPYYL